MSDRKFPVTRADCNAHALIETMRRDTSQAAVIADIDAARKGGLSPVFALRTALHIRSNTRIPPLETRIAELEAKALLTFKGVWLAGTYEAGSLVQRSGGLWLALRVTSEPPGNGSTSWKLVVKRGAFTDGARDQ
jgi:hypothetical protein